MATFTKPLLSAILYLYTTRIIGLGVTGKYTLYLTELTAHFFHHVSGCTTYGIHRKTTKKYIEEGNFGGKGGDVHKATVVGDTVGDPFKDTSGPSLNILIKLMSMVAIVMAGLTVSWSLF